MEVILTPERATKNTVLFREDGDKIKTLYVPKATLAELDWKEGNDIEIEVRVKK
ncbi:MAG: hypothetical protein J6I53_10915 [Treponema sp.]|nr:hypothetical protein [Treponema sp.]